jgi:hypothetical protein
MAPQALEIAQNGLGNGVSWAQLFRGPETQHGSRRASIRVATDLCSSSLIAARGLMI